MQLLESLPCLPGFASAPAILLLYMQYKYQKEKPVRQTISHYLEISELYAVSKTNCFHYQNTAMLYASTRNHHTSVFLSLIYWAFFFFCEQFSSLFFWDSIQEKYNKNSGTNRLLAIIFLCLSVQENLFSLISKEINS